MTSEANEPPQSGLPKGRPKHAKLARPDFGQFGRNEFAFVGTDCSTIKRVCGQIIAQLSAKNWKIGYIDAAHPKGDCPEPLPGRLADGAATEFSDNISHGQFFLKNKPNPFQNRAFFNENNLIFINGNHFAGQKQVVFMDPKKEASLQKRLAQLTDVAAFMFPDGQTAPFEWLKTALPNWAEIPVFHHENRSGLVDFFEKMAQISVAPLSGLVLAGGKSERMGRDKGAIEWYDGEPQRDFLAKMLQKLLADGTDSPEIFIAGRPGQFPAGGQFPVQPDSFTGLGPLGAILTAFREKPGAAWLVVACDLPLLDPATVDFLIKNRRPDCVATAFRNPANGMPEPLITIWEPMSYAVILSFLAQGYSCPRKVLMNADCHLLDAPNPAALTNVNTPEEAAEVQKMGGFR